MATVVRLVLSVPAYATLAVVLAGLALTLFVVPLNWALVTDVVVGGSFPLATRLSVLLALYPFAGGDFGLVQGLVLLLTAGLVGVNAAVAVYHLRHHAARMREGAGSLTGAVLATLGAGCAACGSALLAGLFGLVGVTGALTLLPLEGLEFALLALGVVVLSLHWLAEGMEGGLVGGCPVEI
jgi:hypothetical protein